MFLAHSIRLRDPWQCEPLPGGVRWTRAFHRPTGLEPDDDLWLVLSGLPSDAEVRVNGQSFLTPSPSCGRPEKGPAADANATSETPPFPSPHPPSSLPASFNLTAILADRNEIEILLQPASKLATRDSQPETLAFPYDARLAIMART